MKKEKLIILSGILIALVFFYLGLNEWMKTKEEQVQPPPLVVKPPPQEAPKPAPREVEAPQPQTPPPQETPREAPEQKPEEKQPPKDADQDPLAQKIKEEKKVKIPEAVRKESRAPVRREVGSAEPRVYTVQIGAFRSKEKADRAMERAKQMGYRVSIVEEDNFYKVRLSVETGNIEGELRRLRSVFGGAILK